MGPRTLTIGETTTEDTEELTLVGQSSVVEAMAQIARAVTAIPGGQRLAEMLSRRLSDAQGEATREAQVLDAMLPPVETLTDVAATQLRWNALARESALREFGAWTSGQLAELRGAQTSNPHTTASRWLTAKRIFAVETPAGRLFPALQFTDGEPRPVIAEVLAALAGQLHGWELLLWFTASNGYLHGERPVDLLAIRPDDVVAAAAYQASLSED